MGKEIQKATGVPLTFQKQPEMFLAEVGSYLETIQLVYRSKLPQQELVLWRETLKDYSYQEFNQAMTHLISNPPKYELEDGSIQTWRGMPKLPDVVDVILDLRDKSAQAAEKRKSDELAAEEKRNEARRQLHPEEFIGMKELQEIAQKLQGGVKKMPAQKREYAPLDLDKNANKLRQQAADLMKGKP
jgi:hypothetical protein